MDTKKNLLIRCFTVVFVTLIVFSACDIEEDPPPPTKSSMEGVWVVKEGYAANGDTLNDKLMFPITVMHLSSDNTVISTAGPMWMYIVYGDNKWTNIAAKFDAVFNYAGLDINGGEFFVGGGVQERFTAELKLEGAPGQAALTDILDILGIGQDYLDVVVYHKFKNVKVDFSNDYNTMTWEWDDVTTATYNTKDQFGDLVLWEGWPVDNFQRASFVLQKQSRDVQTIVTDCVNGDC